MAKTAVAAPPGAGKAGDDEDPPGMDKLELKQILKYAKAAPLSVTFATDADGQAMLRMHRRRPPRTLERDMKRAAPDSRNHRFGTVTVSPEQPKLVRFQINKATGGMAHKLVLALKGTGYTRVEINSDDGAPPEGHEEADPAADGTDDGAKPAAAKGPSPGKLLARLTPLVREMVEVIHNDPSQKGALQKLATAAQASLQRALQSRQAADLDHAEDDIDHLAEALADAAAPPPPPPPPSVTPKPRIDPQRLTSTLTDLAKQAIPLMKADPVAGAPIRDHLTKAQTALKGGALDEAQAHTKALHELVTASAATTGGPAGAKLFNDLAAQWHEAEQRAQAGVKKLKAALDDLYHGDPAAAQMQKDFQAHIDTIFGKFDGTLVQDVRKATAAKTAAELAALKTSLRRTVTDMIKFLDHDSVALMDSNPLVDVNIVGGCETALKSMLAALG